MKLKNIKEAQELIQRKQTLEECKRLLSLDNAQVWIDSPTVDNERCSQKLPSDFVYTLLDNVNKALNATNNKIETL